MKCKHTTPCAECPWRRQAPAGHLGGHSPDYYADAVSVGEVPACHLSDHGPEDDRTAFCAGAASVMANQSMRPYKQGGALETVRAVGKRDDTFSHHSEFYEHHARKPYEPYIIRRLKGDV